MIWLFLADGMPRWERVVGATIVTAVYAMIDALRKWKRIPHVRILLWCTYLMALTIWLFLSDGTPRWEPLVGTAIVTAIYVSLDELLRRRPTLRADQG